MSTPRTERPLELPITGQALRQAVEARDMRCLSGLAAQLRIAGYRIEPQRLLDELLQHGSAPLTDAFGHRLHGRLRSPEAATAPARDPVRAHAA